MDYKKFGNTDFYISALGFGAMRLPIAPQSIDFTEAISLMHYALKTGINFFDIGTFYCHFQCEKVFGLAINDQKPAVILSGKNTTHLSDPGNWTAQLKNTLHLYNREALDFYFIHYLEYKSWEKHFLAEGIIEQVHRARRDGLIRYLGFSSHDTPGNIIKLIDAGPFDAVILSYNMLNRTYEDAIQYAYNRGLGVIVMNPLAGGVLTDSFVDFPRLREYFHATIPAIALKFAYSNPHVHCVLSGMQTKSEIDSNIQIEGGERFSPIDTAFINEMVAQERDERLVLCTGCNYCLPCPQGIDIPKVIGLWNQFNMVKGKNFFQRDYHMLDVTADCCIACESCEERCPNHINISVIMHKAGILFA
jgi:uncharacterized protein